MKKILAILGIFATIFALASCKKELTPEEAAASKAAAQSVARAELEKSIAASIKQEENIVKDKEDTLNDLGKTEKNKRIVYIGNGTYEGMKISYEIMTFDANGKYSGWKRYVYFPDTESFDRAISDTSPDAKFAYESSDSSLRLIIYKYTNNAYLANETYDVMLQRVRDNGYAVVE